MPTLSPQTSAHRQAVPWEEHERDWRFLEGRGDGKPVPWACALSPPLSLGKPGIMANSLALTLQDANSGHGVIIGPLEPGPPGTEDIFSHFSMRQAQE